MLKGVEAARLDNQYLIEIIKKLYNSNRAEREDILQQNLTKIIGDLSSRGVLHSSIAENKIGRLYGDELKKRTEIAWNYIKEIFEKRNLFFPAEDLVQIENEIKDLTNAEMNRLSAGIQRRFRGKDKITYLKIVETYLASARNQILSKINAELNIYVLPDINPSQEVKQKYTETYIEYQRIESLKGLDSSDFDLSRLVRLCEELNLVHQQECYMSTAMLVRAIIDHIPPIFKCDKFPQVANNYDGTRSFKESMGNLENSLRKIADAHLHVQIRQREVLPTVRQVNFSADLDVLLSEIIRIMQ